jgi:arginyl-tRNA synthetase
MLYVVGAPQAQHLQMVFEVCRMAGWLTPPTEAIHVAFGSVLGNDRKMLRSRSGDSVKLVDLLDEAIERAAAAVDEKNPALDPDTRAAVARMVGIGAVKYADLSTDRVKDYVFDWDRMLAFEGNTAPYVQYAHARVNQVFARAGVERADVRGAPISVDAPQERALALQVLGLPTAFGATLDAFAPHKLCTYVYDLAVDFSAFYEHCPILRSEEPVRTGRLALADLTARTIELVLDLLGIAAPERM